MRTANFAYCLSNPPYQEDGSNDANNRASNIFHYFYNLGTLLAESTSMIFPGGRWMQKSTLGKQASEVIYPNVSSIDWYPNGDEPNIDKIFPNIRIQDGISIVSAERSYDPDYLRLNGEVFPRPTGNEILPLSSISTSIIRKVSQKSSTNINHRKLPRMFFGLPSNFVEQNPDKVSKDSSYGIEAWLANDKIASAKKVEQYFIEEDSIKWNRDRETVAKGFKVVASQASVSKTPANAYNRVLGENVVVGESWVILGFFPTQEEAENYQNYINSNLVKKVLNSSKGGKLKTWGLFVSDLEDYSNKNPLFNGSAETFDQRLYEFFNLTPEEVEEIEEN